jgi:hypothetical protein
VIVPLFVKNVASKCGLLSFENVYVTVFAGGVVFADLESVPCKYGAAPVTTLDRYKVCPPPPTDPAELIIPEALAVTVIPSTLASPKVVSDTMGNVSKVPSPLKYVADTLPDTFSLFPVDVVDVPIATLFKKYTSDPFEVHEDAVPGILLMYLPSPKKKPPPKVVTLPALVKFPFTYNLFPVVVDELPIATLDMMYASWPEFDHWENVEL